MLNEQAKLTKSITGLQFDIFIDSTQRNTHSGRLRVKFQGTGYSTDSTSWPSLAITSISKREFKIYGNVAKTPVKAINDLKSWIVVNYSYLKELASLEQSPTIAEMNKFLKKFRKGDLRLLENKSFSWQTYRRYFGQAICVDSFISKIPANIYALYEIDTDIPKVVFVQNTVDGKRCPWKDFDKYCTVISVENEPKLLNQTDLPIEIIEATKTWVQKHKNAISKFWNVNSDIEEFSNAIGYKWK